MDHFTPAFPAGHCSLLHSDLYQNWKGTASRVNSQLPVTMRNCRVHIVENSQQKKKKNSFMYLFIFSLHVSFFYQLTLLVVFIERISQRNQYCLLPCWWLLINFFWNWESNSEPYTYQADPVPLSYSSGPGSSLFNISLAIYRKMLQVGKIFIIIVTVNEFLIHGNMPFK